jgi:hypothetical protein
MKRRKKDWMKRKKEKQEQIEDKKMKRK